MAFNSGSRHYVQYVAETVFGTTPAAADTKEVPIVSISLSPSKDVFTDPSIRSDRSIRFQRHGNIHLSGDLETAYQAGTYDDLLAAALHGDWVGNVLRQGVTKKSFTIERGFLETATPFYQRFTGCVVNEFTLEVPVNDVIRGTYSLMAAGTTSGSAALDASPQKLEGSAPMTHLNGTFMEGGAATGNMTAITLTVANGYSENFVLGGSTPKELSPGYATVTGTITAYFDGASQYNKFMAETETALSFAINDGAGSTHTWLLPRVKFNGYTMPVTSDQAITVTIPFVALTTSAAHATPNTAIQVTRSAAP